MTGASPDPLHGVTLAQVVERLQAYYGWEELGRRVRIRCFQDNPSVQSSLKFLRRTPWARTQVEELYRFMLRKHPDALERIARQGGTDAGSTEARGTDSGSAGDTDA